MITKTDFYRPKTKEELFNLRHATLRNVIERIFGVLKRRFRILLLAPEYNMEIQGRLSAALCALHNFIRSHGPEDEAEIQEMNMDFEDEGVQEPVIPAVEPEAGEGLRRNQAIELRNRIADELWAQYQGVLHDRAGDINESDDDVAEDDELEAVMEM
jgi:DDE superfamily endonuclease